jgi:hypothetical protein
MYAAVSAALGRVSAMAHDAIRRVNSYSTYQIVKLYCGNTLVDTRDDLLRDSSRINMIGVKAITQSGDTGCDFIKLHALLAAVY